MFQKYKELSIKSFIAKMDSLIEKLKSKKKKLKKRENDKLKEAVNIKNTIDERLNDQKCYQGFWFRGKDVEAEEEAGSGSG